MPFVTQLDIKEFRGIKECREPLRFSKFNVLLGRNNSEKSTVLQALFLLPRPDLPQPMRLGLRGTRRDHLLHHLTGGASSLVYRYAGEARLYFKFGEKKYEINLDAQGMPRASSENALFSSDAACEYLGVKREEAENWAVFVPNDTEFQKRVEGQLSQEWASVEKSESHIKVIKEVINPTIDEEFTEIIRRDSSLYVRKDPGVYINLRDLGDGVEKTLSILLFIDYCSPKLVLWDDFEVSAHPSLLRNVLRWLSQRDWQVVLATHSIDVLYELTEIRPEECTVIQLKKTADDVLVHKNLTVEEVEDYLSASNDPRLLVDLIEVS